MSATGRNSLGCVKERIEAVISHSSVPEDPVHSKNTLEWLLRLRPHADEALRLAALGHDIERAVEEKVKRKDFPDFESFKAAHAKRSAELLKKIMLDCGVEDTSLIERVHALVLKHEIGGDPDSDLLRDADALSFFDVNISLYFERNGWEETRRRALWGLRRLSEGARAFVEDMRYEKKELNTLLREVLKEAQSR